MSSAVRLVLSYGTDFTKALPYLIEPNCICSWIADHCVLPWCLEKISQSPVNWSNLLKWCHSKLNQTAVQLIAEHCALLGPPEGTMSCIPDTRSTFTELLSYQIEPTLQMQLNSWALCAPQMPRGDDQHSQYQTRFDQNCTSRNWIKIHMQLIAEYCLLPATRKNIPKSCEPIQFYWSSAIPNWT